ncbi:MAG: hypothetical protein MUE34_05755 [Acidimicrobiales bacterium]|jgi:hypothetical protein|nr:hypothetical protein [Acidimicrobiales bacterium]
MTDHHHPRTAVDADLLATCMAGMAAGDASLLWTFLDAFGDRLAAVVRGALRDFHREDVARDADAVHGLVLDVAFVLFDRAHGWRPGGAAPWHWARAAVRAEVANRIGHRTEVLDLDRLDRVDREPVTLPASVEGSAALDRLAARHPEVAAFTERLDAVASPRDRQVFAEYLLQQSHGDPSPSHTVAAILGLTPANVRQIVCRVRGRVRSAA